MSKYMSKEVLNILKIIKEKEEEITKEYNNILINYKELQKKHLKYVTTCSDQYNSMKKILEELINEIKEVYDRGV